MRPATPSFDPQIHHEASVDNRPRVASLEDEAPVTRAVPNKTMLHVRGRPPRRVQMGIRQQQAAGNTFVCRPSGMLLVWRSLPWMSPYKVDPRNTLYVANSPDAPDVREATFIDIRGRPIRARLAERSSLSPSLYGRRTCNHTKNRHCWKSRKDDNDERHDADNDGDEPKWNGSKLRMRTWPNKTLSHTRYASRTLNVI